MRRGGAVQPVPPSRSVRSGRQAGRTVRVNSFLDEIVIPLRERVVRAERDRVSITAGLGCSVQTLVCRRQLRDASLSCPASSPVASCGFGRAVEGLIYILSNGPDLTPTLNNEQLSFVQPLQIAVGVS